MSDRMKLADAIETVHGYVLGIYQDHDGIRIDAGLREYMLDREAAIVLRDAIDTALYEAALWEADNADA